MAGFNHFPALAKALDKTLGEIVSSTARSGESNVKDQIQANQQVDTGFMLESVYHVTVDESTYGQGGAPPGDSYLLPEVARPEDAMTAYFASGANYSIYQNYGTRFLPPRPFWEPGVEKTRKDFEDDLSKIENALKGAVSLTGSVEVI